MTNTDGEEIMLTNKAMLEILGLVAEEECGGAGSQAAFTVQNCRDNQRDIPHFGSLTSDGLIFISSQRILTSELVNWIFPLIAVDRTEEYNHLNEISHQFHQIQIVLYHGPHESSKLETILGLIDVNKILDDRLQGLFKAGYNCPEEIHFINNLLMYVSHAHVYKIFPNGIFRKDGGFPRPFFRLEI